MEKRWESWWPTIAAVGTAVMTAVDIVLNFSGLLPALKWVLGGTIFVILVAWQILKLNNKIRDFENSKPIIKVEDAYVDSREVIVSDLEDSDLLAYSGETGTYSRLVYGHTESVGASRIYWESPYDVKENEYFFAHATFINRPKISTNDSEAKRVWAEIEFLDTNLKNIKGRWSQTNQPQRAFTNRDLLGVTMVDFPANEFPWDLDIVMQSPKENIAFVFNNQSYLFREFRNPDFVLKEGSYTVRVVLRGVRLDSPEYLFDLEIRDKLPPIFVEHKDA